MTKQTLLPKLQSAPATDSRVIGAVIVARPKLKPQSALTPATAILASVPMQSKIDSSAPSVPIPAPAATITPAATTVPVTSSIVPTTSSAPPIEHYRDLSDIIRLVASKPGMFWCYTHLADLPLSEQSLDPRYCRRCYKVLSQEASDMKSSGIRRKPWWILKATGEKTVKVVEQPSQIMSTSNAIKNTVDIIPLTVPTRRGPKNHVLPDERIIQLAFSGMGSKAIATKLQSEGCSVSYKTVQRRLRQAVMA